MTEETVRRHLQPSFVYTILDIGQDKASPGKGNRHQLEICQAKHALESSRKDNNGCERIIEGGWKIYAGDKFKTHVLWATESQWSGLGNMRQQSLNRSIVYLLSVAVCLLSFVCWVDHHTRSYQPRTIRFDPVILVTAQLFSPSLQNHSQKQVDWERRSSLGDWLVLRVLLT